MDVTWVYLGVELGELALVYRMAGYFRGVLTFIIFMVDLAVTKISHPL